MDEGLKNKIIVVLGVLCVIFLIIGLGSCSSSTRFRKAHDKEMASRLDSEEKLNKYIQDKNQLESRFKVQAKDLEEAKDKIKGLEKALNQEKLVNQSLKDELEKVSKLKDALEQDVKSSSSKAKKR